MSRSILLADDSVTIQKVIELTFMDEDYEVKAVSNGDEAVALLAGMHPDLVIADVHMPGANGYEVARRAKALAPGRPVLLLVGTFEPFDEAEARSSGADRFLKKPFDSQELLQLAGELLQGASAAPAAAPAPATLSAPVEAAPFAMPALDAIDEARPGLGAVDSDPIWSSFKLEPDPALAPSPAAAPASSWEAPAEPQFFSPPDEQVFELDGGDVLALDDSLDDEEGLSLDAEPFEPSPVEPASAAPFEWREERAAAPASVPLPEPTPEERIGVPLGAAPLMSSFDEVEHAVAEHDGAPAFASASPSSFEPSPEAVAVPAGRLSDEDVERIARRVVELAGERVVRDVAWEVVPDLAELVIKDRLRELESQVE